MGSKAQKLENLRIIRFAEGSALKLTRYMPEGLFHQNKQQGHRIPDLGKGPGGAAVFVVSHFAPTRTFCSRPANAYRVSHSMSM